MQSQRSTSLQAIFTGSEDPLSIRTPSSPRTHMYTDMLDTTLCREWQFDEVFWGCLLGLLNGELQKGKSNCHASCVVAKPSFRTARGKHDDDTRLCIKTFGPPSTDKKFFPTVCFDSEPKQRTPMKNESHPSSAICAHLVLDKDLEETIRSK